MTTEGVYHFTAEVIGPDGILYEDTIIITVLNRDQLDALLRAKWEGMKGLVMAQNTEGALAFIIGSTQEMYRYNFELMRDILPSILQPMSDINLDEIEDGIAKYHMNSIQDGTNYSFYVEFVKDGDGLWKISFF